jgi:predicted DNA-binding transcriptional regulator AlpA
MNPSAADRDPSLDEAQLCARFRISRKTAQKWRQTNRGPRFVKVGRLVRYRESDVQAWVDQQTRTNTTQTSRPTLAAV